MTDWRANYGLPDKPIRRCPVCGVESVGGKSCNYHTQQERNKLRIERMAFYRRDHAARLRAARDRLKVVRKVNRLITALEKGVDEGRQAPKPRKARPGPIRHHQEAQEAR